MPAVLVAAACAVAMLGDARAVGRAGAAGFPPSETVLPASTRVWASAADPQGLRSRFERSAFGGLVYEPLMSTFLDGLRQQGRSSIDPLRGSLEITPAEVAKIAGGEVALAAVERADGLLATLLLVDTTGREDAVRSVVDDLVARVVARGAQPLTAPEGIRAFSLPSAAAKAGTAAAGNGAAVATGTGTGKPAPPRQIVVLERPATVVVGDRIDAVADLAAAVAAPPAAGTTLAALPAFATTMDRTGRDVPAAAPTVRWFADPLAYLAADRRTNPPKNPRKTPDYAAILARHGFDVVTGAGGRVFFGEGGVDLRTNTLVCAPGANAPDAEAGAAGAASGTAGPATATKAAGRAAKMLRFPNVPGLGPAAWVPSGAASWTAFEWDIADAFDALPPLFDDLIGEQGVFEDVIASLKEDPDGPQIDVSGDLVRHLGRRVVVASDHVPPLGADSQRTLIAIETGNPAVVADVLAKGIATEGGVRRVESGGHVIWETVRQEPSGAAAGGRGAGDDASGRRRMGGRERREREPAWPNLSVTVANGHIFLASHRDFLERVLAASPQPSIAGEDRYRRAAAAREGLLPGDVALTGFTDTGRLVRPAWDLLRAGRLPESRGLAATMIMRVLDRDRTSGGTASGPRRQEVDGSSLPEFELMARYFGTSAVGMKSTPDGWYIVGVGLWDAGKATPAAAQ